MNGDVNGNGIASIEDVLLVVEGFQGNFSHATLRNVDLFPCVPNYLINIDDVLWCVEAFQGGTYADTWCPPPCS